MESPLLKTKEIFPLLDIIEENPIFMGYAGSMLHGTVIYDEEHSTDDIDFFCVAVPGIDYYLGIREYGSSGTRTVQTGMIDIVSYEARKYMKLLAKGNPNVMFQLWSPRNMTFIHACAWDHLVEVRERFITQKVYDSTIGYAMGQIERAEKEKVNPYMGEKRKALMKKYGYDIKNAAHAMMILCAGIELFGHGQITFPRPEAELLKEIKTGKYSLEEVKEMVEDKREELKSICKEDFQPSVESDFVNDLCVKVVAVSLSLGEAGYV